MCCLRMIWTTSTILPQASQALEQSRCAVADVPSHPHLHIVDVVIRLDIEHDSLRVSTSSTIANRDVGGVSLFVPKLHTRALLAHSRASSNTLIVAFCSTLQRPAPNRRIADSFQISPTRVQICNRPTIDLLPDLACLCGLNGIRPLT